MPLNEVDLQGTEKDGSKSHEYCIYCYQQGKFINPDMTLEQMRLLVEKIMVERKIPSPIIEAGLKKLPSLNRWKQQLKSNSLIM